MTTNNMTSIVVPDVLKNSLGMFERELWDTCMQKIIIRERGVHSSEFFDDPYKELLQQAGPAFLDNRHFIEEALLIIGYRYAKASFIHASDRLRNDADFVRNLLEHLYAKQLPLSAQLACDYATRFVLSAGQQVAENNRLICYAMLIDNPDFLYPSPALWPVTITASEVRQLSHALAAARMMYEEKSKDQRTLFLMTSDQNNSATPPVDPESLSDLYDEYLNDLNLDFPAEVV